MAYLFDTYLPTKTGWTVSAHPDASAFKRSVKLSLPSPWAGGSNTSCYWWITWGSTSPSSWIWYEDATYTTVPGDLGTDTTNYFGTATAWTGFPGAWRIWECTTDPQAILVTKGKMVIMFWPGPTEWFLRENQSWTGANDTNGACWGPYIGQTYGQLMNFNYPFASGTSTAEYAMTVDVGHNTTNWSALGGGPYWLMTGVRWLTSASTTSNYPSSDSNPAFARTGADIAWFLTDSNTDSNRELTTDSSAAWSVLFESNSSKYWLMGTSDLNKQALALDMGASEPDFS
jgi:hypothetical protein